MEKIKVFLDKIVNFFITILIRIGLYNQTDKVAEATKDVIEDIEEATVEKIEDVKDLIEQKKAELIIKIKESAELTKDALIAEAIVEMAENKLPLLEGELDRIANRASISKVAKEKILLLKNQVSKLKEDLTELKETNRTTVDQFVELYIQTIQQFKGSSLEQLDNLANSLNVSYDNMCSEIINNINSSKEELVKSLEDNATVQLSKSVAKLVLALLSKYFK